MIEDEKRLDGNMNKMNWNVFLASDVNKRENGLFCGW